jgi:HEPN pEK499 p136
MSYPIGPLLAALADRILSNLETIESLAPDWGSPEQNKPPYADTQLLISLLGVLVFPHEQAPEALGNLLKDYKLLDRVLTVRHPRHGPKKLEITDRDGEAVFIDPAKLTELPALLRNSIAHFNILPIDANGRFAGIRVWNRNTCGQITFVADVHFDEMRRLAGHVLNSMRNQRVDVALKDPHDPMIEVDAQMQTPLQPRTRRKKNLQHLNPEIWDHLVDAHDGDAKAAKTTLDGLVKKEADRLRAVRKA